ncbi:DNA-directed RNA polymerase subunit beta [Nocardia niwae]|uniref:DNA-directed RNA polymerase subunit beta n=1 Tax=Nocardia niwae TaxID=626084 RepID=A0ABV2XCY0_9NOCA
MVSHNSAGRFAGEGASSVRGVGRSRDVAEHERPDVRVGESAEQRCAFYRRVCGLPTRVDPALDRIELVAGSVGAVTMPAHIGAGVRHHMQVRQHALGPIFTHPRSGTWTFLIRPDFPDDPRLFAMLFRHQVKVIRNGGLIALPSPVGMPAGVRRWIEPARDTYRPLGAVVIFSVRACVGPRSSSGQSCSRAS